jgi:pimeloyl-ACP methyl ester carboxylesterase
MKGGKPVTTEINKALIPTTWYYRHDEESPTKLWIMLPGLNQPADVFEKHNFIEKLKGVDFRADIVAVDADLNYYMERTLTKHLLEDIIIPARERGYKKIYLVGISMGALGALIHARKHPETIDGVFAIAPFLGNVSVVEEISSAGGLRSWQPKDTPDYEEDFERSIWFWLKQYELTIKNEPPLFLGFGESDDFTRANRILATVLPEDRVFTAPGGHDWQSWIQIFDAFLASGAFRALRLQAN